ncbi:MAG: hypothetical protein GY906_10995 [bacterium]|nr:hypothetical protein [bacterium]
MTSTRSSVLVTVFGVLLVVTAMPGLAQDLTAGYHSFESVNQKLEGWAQEYAAIFELQTIGRSAAGAPLMVARVAAAGEVDPDQRPAVFVGANMAGFHNAGTEAALHLLETLLTDDGEVLSPDHTYYVAPVLNPDAHDGMFRNPKQRLAGNGARWSNGWTNTYGFDRDVDGFEQEDGANDLNGDGVITKMRIPDVTGNMVPDPDDPRVLIKADPLEGQFGQYRVVSEGDDDDADGAFNEDGVGAIAPNSNFAHRYEDDKPEAGPWPSFAPESQAVMDFLLGQRNVAVAVVFGPANNLLAIPQGFGGGGDTGTQKLEVPERIARFMGLDPEQKYTADEIWAIAKSHPMVKQNNITKDQLIQFLGAGPATKPEDDDIGLLNKLAEAYEKTLEDAGLDAKRAGKQYGDGGFTPWLYYQGCYFALELDVWGVPKAKAEEAESEEDAPLTLEVVAEMSSEDFLALGAEKIGAFLKDIGAPPQFTAESLMQRVESGQLTPERLAQMAKQMGGGGGESKKAEGGPNDLMVFIDEHAPSAFVPWTEVTLVDGSTAEVGGVDPFIEVAPPYEILEPALAVHTATVLDIASKLAQVEILELKSTSLGGDVFRVEAVAGNRQFMATHSKMAQRARTHLPIRLEVSLPDGVVLITGTVQVTADRLEGTTGSMSGEWLIKASGLDPEIVVEVVSENAGKDRATLTLEGRS